MRRSTRRGRAGGVRVTALSTRSLVALAAATLAIGTAACGGGGGGERFEADGIGVTFEYPAEFHPTTSISFARSAGSRAAARGGVALDRDNAIIVSRYDLRATVTGDSLARYKHEVDGVIGRLAGRAVSGRRVEYGGLPGYEYAIGLAKPAGAESRMAVLFDGATEYLVNCQSTPSKRSRLEAGCRRALETIARR